VVVQVGDGRPRVLESFHDHPLEPLAQHGFDGALHPGWDLQEIRDGTDHAVQRGAPALGEYGTDPGPVTLARALELGQRLEARAPHGQLDARVGEPCLGLRQPACFVDLLRVEPTTLLLERAELRGGPVARHR